MFTLLQIILFLLAIFIVILVSCDICHQVKQALIRPAPVPSAPMGKCESENYMYKFHSPNTRGCKEYLSKSKSGRQSIREMFYPENNTLCTEEAKASLDQLNANCRRPVAPVPAPAPTPVPTPPAPAPSPIKIGIEDFLIKISDKGGSETIQDNPQKIIDTPQRVEYDFKVSGKEHENADIFVVYESNDGNAQNWPKPKTYNNGTALLIDRTPRPNTNMQNGTLTVLSKRGDEKKRKLASTSV